MKRFNGDDWGCGYCAMQHIATKNKVCDRGESLKFDQCGTTHIPIDHYLKTKTRINIRILKAFLKRYTEINKYYPVSLFYGKGVRFSKKAKSVFKKLDIYHYRANDTEANSIMTY